MTTLGRAASTFVSKLALALSKHTVREPGVLPGPSELAGIPYTLVLIGLTRHVEIEMEVRAEMSARKCEQDITTQHLWQIDQEAREVAEAYREGLPEGAPADFIPPPLGTYADWARLEPEYVHALWTRYAALRVSLDPLAIESELTREERGAIEEAIKKNDRRLLLYLGAPRLATYLLTSGSPPQS